jgi:hypothetical protein
MHTQQVLGSEVYETEVSGTRSARLRLCSCRSLGNFTFVSVFLGNGWQFARLRAEMTQVSRSILPDPFSGVTRLRPDDGS